VDDLLFYRGGELGHALEAQREKMREAVEKEPEESLKQVDVDEWAAALAHHFAVVCPTMRTDAIWMEPPKLVKIDVSWDQSRYFSDLANARSFPGERIIIHIPFTGEADVFKLRTNPYSLSPPRGRVKGSDLLLTIDYPRDRAPDVDAQAQAFIGQVSKHLGWAGDQINAFNAALEQQARQAIEARRQRVERRDAELAKSSIPIRRPGESTKKTYIADVLVRRPAPSRPQTRADEKAPKLEPVLEERIFEHILDVIRKQGLHIEQNPRTYVPMGEEDRRNVILSALTTHYDGFTAETDNQGGHTDILARHDGRNVFICECKFWEGSEGFTDTVDQLFRYVGWRDTKLAIVMFVREKGLTAILKKARATLSRHPQFVASKEAASETELRATMCWPGDEERLADLNIFFLHTPEGPVRKSV
jgi:RecB family endonuclease NucS